MVKTPVLVVGTAVLWSFLLLAVAFLMISTVRYYSFKEMPFRRQGSRFALLSVGILLAAIYSYSEQVLLTIAVVYLLSGPVSKLLPVAKAIRRLLHGQVPPAEAAHGNIKT